MCEYLRNQKTLNEEMLLEEQNLCHGENKGMDITGNREQNHRFKNIL